MVGMLFSVLVLDKLIMFLPTLFLVALVVRETPVVMRRGAELWSGCFVALLGTNNNFDTAPALQQLSISNPRKTSYWIG